MTLKFQGEEGRGKSTGRDVTVWTEYNETQKLTNEKKIWERKNSMTRRRSTQLICEHYSRRPGRAVVHRFGRRAVMQ